MSSKSHIKPLGKRQIFHMKRASLEKRVNDYYRATQDTANILENLVAILVRNALIFSDLSFICQELVTDIYLTAEPNDVLRQFSSIFKPYFKKSGDWNTVIHRLFNNKKEYHQSAERYRLAVKYLYTEKAPIDEENTTSYNLVSVFKDANGKKHKWTLKDADPERQDAETAVLLKLLTDLTIFKNKEVRQFVRFMAFDYIETTNIRHYEEDQEVQQETAEKSDEGERERLEIMVPHGFDPRMLSETELIVLVQAYLPEGKTIDDVHVFFMERPADSLEDKERQVVSPQSSSKLELETPIDQEKESLSAASVGIASSQESVPKKRQSNSINHLSGKQLSAMSLINKSRQEGKPTASFGKTCNKNKQQPPANGTQKRRKRKKRK